MLQKADDSSRALPRQRFLGLAASGAAALALSDNTSSHPAPAQAAVGAEGTTPSHAATPPAGALQPAAGVGVILAAFTRVSIVALGNPHGCQEQADFISSLLQHPTFPTLVNDIVVEGSNARYQPLIDRFVSGAPVANAELRHLWREGVGATLPGLEDPVAEQFFRTVRGINQALPSERRLRVLLGEPAADWRLIQRRAEYDALIQQRDTFCARLVEQEVLRKGRRALLLRGTLHLLRRGPDHDNVIQLIERRHRASTYIVAWHTGFGERTVDLERRLASWPKQAIAPVQGTWLGALGADVVFGDGVFLIKNGKPIAANPFKGLKVQELVDGYLYLGRRAELTTVGANPALYRGDPEYLTELDRRARLLGQPLNLAALFSDPGPLLFPPAPRMLPPGVTPAP